MTKQCDFYMKIKGESDDVELLFKWFNSEYDLWNNICEERYHFYNISSFEVTSNSFEVTSEDLICEGCCIGSAGECLLDGKDSYYQKYLSTDTFGMNLIIATRLLHLVVEVISVEPEANFTEHIIVDNGKLIKNEFAEIFTEDDYASITDSSDWSDFYLNTIETLIEFTI